MIQLQKLEKVLAFYQQQLELIKTKFAEQSNTVQRLMDHATLLNAELVSLQRRASAAQPSVIACQLTAHCMQSIEINIRQNDAELIEESTKCDVLRLELGQQMSKIEAMEKVVANKSKALEHLRRQAEQHLADERYLNTHFNGSKK